MRVFVLVLFLIMPFMASGATCPAGQYLYYNTCDSCSDGYYCPGDDQSYECPADNTKWNKLLEECGYHPLEEIKSGDVQSLIGDDSNFTYFDFGDAYDISHCRATGPLVINFFKLQEGDWAIFQSYNSARGDYWNGCDQLKHFGYANKGYYLSTYYGTSDFISVDWYNAIKPCTNAPENAHYTGAGTPDDPVKSGGKKDYNDCPWKCDDGYTLQDGECVVALCAAGYYKPTADSECTACPNGYYCPDDDKSDDAIPCPPDTTDWNKLLEGCGYHPLQDIKSNSIDSWGHNAPAAEISNCYARSKVNKFKEGLWEMELPYGSQRNDYWHGCDTLKFFYAANPGYYLSTYNSTTYEDWYYYIKPCTNEHPAHSHYSGPGTPDDPVAGGKKDYNDCPWACDDGYGLHEGACLPLCAAGATKFHAGDYVFNIYADKLTTLAINIELGNGTVCYVPLVEGPGKGALNVDYHGVIYHTSD